MAYTVEWEEIAKAEADILRKKYPRFSDAVSENGLEWTLARRPIAFPTLSQTSLRLTKIGPFFPENGDRIIVNVFFKIVSEDRVLICFLEEMPMDD